MVKTEIHKEPDQVRVTIVGKIDEHFDGQDILSALAGKRKLVMKMDGVRSISSLGVRALEAFMGALGDRALAVQLLQQSNAEGRQMDAWHYTAALDALHGYAPFEALVTPER